MTKGEQEQARKEGIARNEKRTMLHKGFHSNQDYLHCPKLTVDYALIIQELKMHLEVRPYLAELSIGLQDA